MVGIFYSDTFRPIPLIGEGRKMGKTFERFIKLSCKMLWVIFSFPNIISRGGTEEGRFNHKRSLFESNHKVQNCLGYNPAPQLQEYMGFVEGGGE